MEDLNNPIYIPLGSDCSVAYQLQELNLRSFSFPFDWIRINLDNLLRILNNNFQFFTEEKYLEKCNIDELGKFPLIDEVWPREELNKNNIIVENTFYKLKFYHDFNQDLEISFEEQIKNFQEKYLRRIERFQQICQNKDIKKIFIRICKNTKEKEILEKVLENYCTNNNFELKIIIIDNKQKFSSWKKDELSWLYLFTNT